MSNNQGWDIIQNLFGAKSAPSAKSDDQSMTDQSNKPTPESELVRLRQNYRRKHATMQKALEDYQTEKLQIQREIQALQEKLAQLGRDSIQIQHNLDDLNSTFHQEEARLLQSGLVDSFKTFRSATEFWSNLLDLRTQRQKMLKQDPELEDVLADFLELDQQLTEVVANLPKSYRQPLEDRHYELDQRVRPYLKLKQTEEALQYLSEVQLMVIAAPQLNSRKISWIIPIPADIIIDPVVQSTPLYEVGNALLEALIGLSLADKWYFDDFQLTAWSGFTALTATAEYDGDEPQAQIAEAVLRKYLAESPLFAKLSISINVELIDPVTWELGRKESTSVSAEEIISEENVDTSDSVKNKTRLEESDIPTGVTSDWYTSADIQSWERRVDTVAGSNWNQQSRRLRTALMRLVAKGKFDVEQTPFEALWQGLPSPHAELMKAGLEKLQTVNLLSIKTIGGGANGQSILVSLNSDHLPEIQNLINRDITDFWLPLINDTA